MQNFSMEPSVILNDNKEISLQNENILNNAPFLNQLENIQKHDVQRKQSNEDDGKQQVISSTTMDMFPLTRSATVFKNDKQNELLQSLIFTITSRMQSYQSIQNFEEKQLRIKIQNIQCIENERVRLELELLQKISKNRKANIILVGTMEIEFDIVYNFFMQETKAPMFREQKVIQKIVSQLEETASNEDQYARIFLLSNLSQHCIMYLLQHRMVEYNINITDNLLTAELKKYTVAIHKLKDKKVIVQKQQIQTHKRIKTISYQNNLQRCVLRQDEKIARNLKYDQFMIKYGQVALIQEDLKNKNHWVKVREDSKVKYNLETPQFPSYQRHEKPYDYNQRNYNVNINHYNAFHINEQKNKIVNINRGINSTFKQEKKTLQYPSPPNTEELTCYIDVYRPIKINAKLSGFKLDEIEQKYSQFEGSMLQPILEHLNFRNTSKVQQMFNTSDVSLKSAQNESVDETFDTKSVYTTRNSLKNQKQATIAMKLQQQASPIEMTQNLHTSMFNITHNHWTSLQDGDLQELPLNCYKNIIEQQIEEKIEDQKHQSSDQLALLNKWGEDVLKIASQQKIPDEYVPILTPCTRYIQYYNTKTHETISIHPEVQKVQKMISDQYYQLENFVKLNPQSEVLDILKPLKDITSWKIFFLNHQKKRKLIYKLSEQLQQSAKYIQEQVHLWLKI